MDYRTIFTVSALTLVLAACGDQPTTEAPSETPPPADNPIEGFAETEDGVKIRYRLMGPSDAPTIWVGYPWTDGWNEIMAEMGASGDEFSDSDPIKQLISKLTSRYQVLHVDYPRGTGGSTGPLPGDLTPETVAKDYVAVADAAGVDRFVAMGYSWSAGFGIHVASRTKRCAGLVIGGWPVLGAPHEQIVGMSAANADALPPGPAKEVIGSNVIYYQSIIDSNWDAEAAVDYMEDRAGLLYLYVGSEDNGVPGLGIPLPVADPIIEHKEYLEAHGWWVEVIDGYDHMNLTLDAWLPSALAYLEGKTW
ncbi:MAG: alpha/beta fold hydrolase [Pseudomonadales bacterium]|jgi:pimeloyl-ACP methyl ester carboxylesterase|nr:alpha/beta fold hydrolase [Kiritimatiellia bacterium]MDP6970022.1 alpha/beta fold hydrolase [Pseudomonadales bacterium]